MSVQRRSDGGVVETSSGAGIATPSLFLMGPLGLRMPVVVVRWVRMQHRRHQTVRPGLHQRERYLAYPDPGREFLDRCNLMTAHSADVLGGPAMAHRTPLPRRIGGRAHLSAPGGRLYLYAQWVTPEEWDVLQVMGLVAQRPQGGVGPWFTWSM